MKTWTKWMAALTVTAMVGAFNAGAQDKAADKPAEKPAAAAGDKPEKKAKKAPTVKGEVVKVDGNKLVIAAGKKNEQKTESTITTDDKTVVMIEGVAAKLADLKPGHKVTITPDTGVAAKIEVPAKKEKAPKAAK